VFSRLRKVAVGWDETAPVGGKRPRGGPRQKGWAWKLARLLDSEPVTVLTVAIYGKAETVRAVGRDVWLRDVTCKVRVVAIATKWEPGPLVSTDITLPPAALIQLYTARFPMELPLRDLKQYGGLGVCLHSVGHTEVWTTRPRLAQNAWKVLLSRASRNARTRRKPGDFRRMPARLKRL